MSKDIGLDNYGKGHGKYVSWGYLPHEDKYNKPTIDGRNAALIMKSGVYDGATDTHKLMDQSFAREDMLHAWYDEAERHRIRSTAQPSQPRKTISIRAASTHGRRRSRMPRTGASRPARWRGRWSPAASTAKAGSITIRSCSTCIARWAAPASLLRHFARMHEGVKLYREMERALREFRLNDEWYIKPTERDGRGWGATEAIRGALCHWIEVQEW